MAEVVTAPPPETLPPGWGPVVEWLSSEFTRYTAELVRQDRQMDMLAGRLAQSEQVTSYHADLLPELDQFRAMIKTATQAWQDTDTETRIRVAASSKNTEELERRFEDYVAQQRMGHLQETGGVEKFIAEVKAMIRDNRNEFGAEVGDVKVQFEKYRSQRLGELAQVQTTRLTTRAQIVVAIVTTVGGGIIGGIFAILVILAKNGHP